MSFTFRNGGLSGSRTAALLGVTAVVSMLFVPAIGSARATTSTARPCTATARGAAWKYKGQRGRMYSIVGVQGSHARCSTAAKWMPRLSGNRATLQLKVVPHGWHCSAIGNYSGLARMGQCTVGNAIIEWLPKLKK